MSSKSMRALLAVLGCAAVLAAAIYWLNTGSPTQPSPPASVPQGAQLELEELRAAARRLQDESKWLEAKEKWDDLLGKLPSSPEFAAFRIEAERNCQTCVDRLQPERPPVSKMTFPARKQRPAAVPEDQLIAACPQGRKVRSICYLFVDGKGQNDDWVFRGLANFHYEHRVVVETTVKENRGTAVVFEQHFLDVDELRAISDRELEFHWPESPILKEVWNQLDEQAQQVPAYRVAKLIGKTFDALDPNAKRTLTRLQRFAPGAAPNSDLEIVERVRDLSGQRLELEYVSGLGVTSINVLDGQKLDPDLLDQVARNSTVLADYFVGEAAKQKEDEVLLDAKDLGDLFNLADEGAVRGQIRLQRVSEQPGAMELTITGGDLNVELDELGSKRQVRVEPIEGTLQYSTADMLLNRADATWQVSGRLESTDHLLFGTKNIVDLKIRTYCESQLIYAGGKR